MPTVNLTAQFVRGIRPPAKGRVEYWDTATPGLCLRVCKPVQLPPAYP
jgi:hypothetical protein